MKTTVGKITIFFCLLIVFCSISFAQGALVGIVTDKMTEERLPFTNIIVLDSTGKQLYETIADTNGYYRIDSIPSGKYDIRATVGGYKTLQITKIPTISVGFTVWDFRIEASNSERQDIEIVNYFIPLHSDTFPEKKLYEWWEWGWELELFRDEMPRIPVSVWDLLPIFPESPLEIKRLK